jgi:hypothetical protein
MDHRDALDLIADLALEPARLAGLSTDQAPEAARLREHLAACDACSAELATWELLADAVRDGLADRRLEREAPEAAPAAAREPSPIVRERTLEAVSAVATGRSPNPAGSPGRRPFARVGWLVAAAAVVIAVASSALAVRQSDELDGLRSQVSGLRDVAGAVDRILANPGHAVATLRSADGTAAGTIAWSSTEIVVVTTGLVPPPADEHYRCWVENAGQRTPIGRMQFAGATGYWAGELGSYGAIVTADSRFGVSVEPPPGNEGGGTVLLVSGS